MHLGIVVTGGVCGISVPDCWLYNLWTHKWVMLPPMLSERHGHKMAAIESKVYIFGGERKWKNRDTGQVSDRRTEVECLDLLSMTWSSVNRLPVEGTVEAVVAMDTSIFVLTRLARKSSMHEYSTAEHSWTERATLSVDTEGATLLVVENKLHIIAAIDQYFGLYERSADRWVSLMPMMESHRFGSATVWDNKVYFSGGIDSSHAPVTDFFVYSCKDKSWDYSNYHLPECLHGHSMFLSTMITPVHLRTC